MTFFKKILICLFLFVPLSLYAQQRGQGQEERVEIPAQIKPKRMQLLHRVANQTIIDGFAFRDEDELNNMIMELIREREILDTNLVNREIERQHRVININFQPNQNFETINLAFGYTTTLVFLDKNGNPWDLFDYSFGDPSLIQAQFRRKNVLTIVPQRHSGTTNLTLMFEEGRMPLSMNLTINNEKVDFITSIYVDGVGNNSQREITRTVSGNGRNDLSYLAQFDGDYMSDILANVVPEGFNEKQVYINNEVVSRRDYRVFQKDEFLYIRTRHRPHHPEPLMVRNSSDGITNVYKIPYITFPLFIMDGRVTTLHIR